MCLVPRLETSNQNPNPYHDSLRGHAILIACLDAQKTKKRETLKSSPSPYRPGDEYAEEQVSAFTTTAGGHVKTGKSLMSVL